LDLLSRFLGRAGEPGELTARPREVGPSFQLLFPEPIELDADGLSAALRAYHPDLAGARAELVTLGEYGRAEVAEVFGSTGEPPHLIGLVGWGPHVVQLVGIAAPMPAFVLEKCLPPAHMPAELKDVAFHQHSHMLLFYAGTDADPLEQHVALAATAAALTRFGATFVLNENGRSAVPAGFVIPDPDVPDDDMLAVLRGLPIPLLYGGFVKIEVEGTPGVWMRTYGMHLWNLPDLSTLTTGHVREAMTFSMFANVLAYLRESGATFAVGHMMQVAEGVHFRLRSPKEDEYFLDSEGTMFVAESPRFEI